MKSTAVLDSDHMKSPVQPAAKWHAAPALTLMLMAPLVAEVLPGATRFSALFVLPIEMCVWGGGALLIRAAVRRWRLGWANMLLLALALAVAEECLIQQTSLAPMVIQIKGQVYARAVGINYVYLLWALVYESVFVVFLPVHLVELLFPKRRDRLWINRAGLIVVAVVFFVGNFLAWFSWTRIARPMVFHVPVYNPPLIATLIATCTIASLIFLALGPFRNKLAPGCRPLQPPAPWLLGFIGGVWAVFWYALVLLAFGIAPAFPSWVAISAGVVLAMAILLVLPRWTADSHWCHNHTFGVIFGTVLGSMIVGFIGFIGATKVDLYFKILANLVAVALLIMLGVNLKHTQSTEIRS